MKLVSIPFDKFWSSFPISYNDSNIVPRASQENTSYVVSYMLYSILLALIHFGKEADEREKQRGGS